MQSPDSVLTIQQRNQKILMALKNASHLVQLARAISDPITRSKVETAAYLAKEAIPVLLSGIPRDFDMGDLSTRA